METLHYAALSEAELQGHFDAWATGRSRRAGTPRWLENLTGWARQPLFSDEWSYGFRPDTLAHDGTETFVLELKYARKGEPLALAEVLHHAHALSHATMAALGPGWPASGPVRPVVVSQFNTWIRDSRRYLISHGFRADRLLVIEVVGLRDERGSVWFLFNEIEGAEPWTPAAYDELPDTVRRAFVPEPAMRYFVRRETDAYAALSGGSKDPDAYEMGVSQHRIARTRDRTHRIEWRGVGCEGGIYGLEREG